VRLPIGWWWPLLAGIATVAALLAGPNRAIAIPAATIAVFAAVLAVVETLVRQRNLARREYDPGPSRPGGLREAFVGGGPGREDLVLACDLLERKLSRPGLRARTITEVASLVRLPPEEFRRYLAQRLDELEGTS
jgi:hypothetical protein